MKLDSVCSVTGLSEAWQALEKQKKVNNRSQNNGCWAGKGEMTDAQGIFWGDRNSKKLDLGSK